MYDRPIALLYKIPIYGFVGLFTVLLVAACSPETSEERLARMHLPPTDYIANVTQGRDTFMSSCSACHGVNAGGSNAGPPLLDPIYSPGHHADLAFHWAVRDGVQQHHWRFGDMPPVEALSPEQVADIVAWIRIKQREAGIK